jgi:hypothetical protein
MNGAKVTNMLYESQKIALHQDHEPEPEGRGLQPVLVEHAFQQPRLHRSDGEIVLAVQGVGNTQGGFMSVGGEESWFPVGNNT